MRLAKGLLGEFAGDAFVREVDEHEVVVGASADEVVAAFNKCACHGLGILDDLLAVRFVAGLEGFAKGHRLASDDVLQGSSLHAWEDTTVEQRAEVADSALHCGQAPWVGEIVANHDDAPARTAQGLVRGGGHHMTMRKRVVEQSCRNQA